MVSKDTVVSDVFSEIFTILNNNVTSATVAGSSVSLRQAPGTGNYWTGAFPDITFEDESEYPLGIIGSPEFEEGISTYSGNTDAITVEIAVFARRAEAAAKFAEKAWHQIRENESSLRDAGLTKPPVAGRTSSDVIFHGGIKVHEYRIPVELEFEVSK